MAWSGIQTVRNDYNDTFKSINENLLKLYVNASKLSRHSTFT